MVAAEPVADNLVLNGSFENRADTPDHRRSLNGAFGCRSTAQKAQDQTYTEHLTLSYQFEVLLLSGSWVNMRVLILRIRDCGYGPKGWLWLLVVCLGVGF